MFKQTGAAARRLLGVTSLIAAAMVATGAAAEDSSGPAGGALSFNLAYTADVQGVAFGAGKHAGRYLDNIDAIADLNLEKAVGWRGASLHGYLLSNSGGAPNDVVGSLQGVDNIEVSRQRARLFELWAEQGLDGGRTTIRAGLYNLNSEFYAKDSAAMLIAPPFGIGAELAATGPNGPSIFPSTGLGVRVNRDFGGGFYGRAAVLNAKSGVIGDTDGVDTRFEDGALVIAEAGLEGPVRLGVGAWRYTDGQPDIRDVTASGLPRKRTAQGAYLLGEHKVAGGKDGPVATGFFRVGLSDGDTTPFKGGVQVGVRVAQVFAGRPDSAFSVGLHSGRTDAKFRANQRDAGVDPAPETGLEITYADRLAGRVSVQPDLQWLHNVGGEASADRWVVGLRLKVDLSPKASS